MDQTSSSKGRTAAKHPLNFLRVLLLCTAALFLLCAGLVYLFDPFFVYHAPLFGLKAVQTDKEYQCVGALRNLNYDSVIVGSSVTENNNNGWYDDLFGCRTVKAVRSYGATADLMYLLSVSHENHDLKYVFYNIDPASLAAGTETTFESVGCPVYLYDRNILNDYPYLFGKDILFEKIPYMIVKSLQGYDEGTAYNWYEGKDFSENAVLSHYQRTSEVQEMLPEDALTGELEGNLSLLTAEVEAHPDTVYYFFFPPYSVLWWDNITRTGEREAYLYNELVCMKTLLGYENVRLYSFQSDADTVLDLDLYMDTLHFSPEVNRSMAERMADADSPFRITTPEEAETAVSGLRSLIETSENTLIKELEDSGAFTYDTVF